MGVLGLGGCAVSCGVFLLFFVYFLYTLGCSFLSAFFFFN